MVGKSQFGSTKTVAVGLAGPPANEIRQILDV